MKYLLCACVLIQSILSATSQDFSEELRADLTQIVDHTEAIQGRFESVMLFPDQGGSFINQVYLVTTDLGEKLVLKVENQKWLQEKTLNEVTALKYLKEYTSIPVPRVLWFDEDATHSLTGREYILMTLVEGRALNHEFERIYSDPRLYRSILEQLADVIAELRRLPFSSIGSLSNAHSNELKCSLDFANLGYRTSCQSFSDYAKRWLQYYLDEMILLKEEEHPNKEYFSRYIPQLKEMLLKANLSVLDLPNEQYFFSHQDFVMKNILVQDGKITGILDWEWSGATVAEFEPKTGLDFLKTPDDIALFNEMLKERGVKSFFQDPPPSRQLFYQVMGELYTMIACYEWLEGKLEHSAKFLDQKLEQRRIRNSEDFDMPSYVKKTACSLDIHLTQLNEILL